MPWLAAALLLSASSGALAQDEDDLEALVGLIEDRFDGQPPREELYRAAMAGVAAHLNSASGGDHNAVLSEEEWQQQLAWARGDRRGIGIEFTLSPGRGLVITDAFDGGPGARAGLGRGDLVVGIDGLPLTGLGAEQIHAAVTSRADAASVRLAVRRGDGELRWVEVERGTYRMASIRPTPSAQVACLRVAFFGQGAASALQRALAETDGGGIVLDLRDNEGGLLEEALAAAELFVDEGAVLLEEVAMDGDIVIRKARRAAAYGGSIVVLANRGTRGPAEAFVAALSDHGRAHVVGTHTAGEASLPSYHQLDGGLVARLSEVRLRGPSGRSWAGEGVPPDLVVEPVSAPLLDSRTGMPPDLQQDAALQLMRRQSPPPD